jgi:hypothetical protein
MALNVAFYIGGLCEGLSVSHGLFSFDLLSFVFSYVIKLMVKINKSDLFGFPDNTKFL